MCRVVFLLLSRGEPGLNQTAGLYVMKGIGFHDYFRGSHFSPPGNMIRIIDEPLSYSPFSPYVNNHPPHEEFYGSYVHPEIPSLKSAHHIV
jgi:hypothetical protein